MWGRRSRRPNTSSSDRLTLTEYDGLRTPMTIITFEVIVIQYPNGTLKCATQPGYYMQWFGTAAHYDKQDTFSFTDKSGIPVQFADGAHGQIEGTLAWQMPISCDQIVKLHTITGSQEA